MTRLVALLLLAAPAWGQSTTVSQAPNITSEGNRSDGEAGNLAGRTIRLLPPSGLAVAIATNQNLTGVADGQFFANNLYIPSDDIAAKDGFIVGWNFSHLFGGPATTGSRVGLNATVRLRAPTGMANANRNYVGLQGGIDSDAGDGGTDLGANAKGALFGFSSYFRCTGQNYLECSGGEINSFAQAGSSMRYKALWTLVGGGSTDVVQGSVYDCMLCESAQQGSVGFQDGMLIGPMNGQFPVTLTGTLYRSIGGKVAKGIDFSTTVFSGPSIAMPGMTVSGTGVVSAAGLRIPLSTPSSSSAPCDVGTISADRSYVYVCTALNTWKRSPLSTW